MPSATWWAGWRSRCAASKARWKIVIGHHPLWSGAGGKFEQAHALRNLILPTLCRYADLYLAGHEHTMEVHTDDCSDHRCGRQRSVAASSSRGAPRRCVRSIAHSFAINRLRTHRCARCMRRGLTWGFAHLSIEGDQATLKIIESAHRRFRRIARHLRAVLRTPAPRRVVIVSGVLDEYASCGRGRPAHAWVISCDGAERMGASGRFGQVFNPATGQVSARVSLASAQETQAAIASRVKH